MNIAVIAANGRSGKAFTEHALAAGHTIRAGVWGKNILREHSRLTIVECDATDENQVKNLITAQDAVVSLIGHVRGSPATVQADAIKNIVNVMKQNSERRIVSLTGTGVRFNGDKITLIDRVLNFAISVIDPGRVQDGKKHVDVLKNSGLDWTTIRVLKLANNPDGQFELSANGPTKNYVSRAEVARAVLQVLENNSFIEQAPIITNSRR